MAVGGDGLSGARFDAFVSYAHGSDARIAERLRWGLQRLGRPFWRTSPRLRVFLDKTTMSANSELWPSICRALDSSEWFVLLASPASARSRWVGRELERWLTTRPVDRLLVVVTEGTVAWDDDAGDIDLARSTALHPALAGAFTHEPRVTDMRWVDDDTDLTLGNPAFADAVADVGAAIHGVPKEALGGAELRERRRSRRALQTTVGILAVLLAMTLLAATVAVRELRESERAQNLAIARLLTAHSDDLAATDPRLAMLLATTAWDFAPIPEARAAMLRRASQPLVDVITPPRLSQFASVVSPDRPTIARASGEPSSTDISIVDLVTGRDVGSPITTGVDAPDVVAHGPGGLVAVASDPTASGEQQLLEVWDTDGRRLVGERLVMSSGRLVKAAVFSPDGRALAVGADAGFDSPGPIVMLLDLATGRWNELPVDRHVSDLAFRPHHRQLAIADIHGGIELRDVADSATVHVLAPPADDGILSPRLAFDPAGQRMVSADGQGVRLWDLRAGRPGPPLLDGGGATAVAFTVDGAQVVGVVGSEVRFWDTSSGEAVDPPIDVGDRSPLTSIDVTGDGRYLVGSSSQDGTIRTWDLRRYRRDGATIEVPAGDPATELPAGTITYSPDGAQVAVGGADGSIRRWSAETFEELAALPDQAPIERPVDGFPMAWTPDGGTLAATGDGTVIQSWSSSTSARGRAFSAGAGSEVRDLAVSRDGLVLAALLESGEVHQWVVATGVPRRPPFPVGNDDTGDVPDRIWFGTDGTLHALMPKTLPDTDISGAVVPWDPTSGRPGAPLRVGAGQTVLYLAVAGDGRWLGVVTIDGTVAVWDLEERVMVHEATGSDDDSPGRLAVRDDGRVLAHVTADGTIKVVSLATGDEVARLTAPYEELGRPVVAAGIAFRPGTDVLTVAWRNRKITSWHVPVPDDLVGELCAVAARPMTADEWATHVGDGEPRDACATVST